MGRIKSGSMGGSAGGSMGGSMGANTGESIGGSMGASTGGSMGGSKKRKHKGHQGERLATSPKNSPEYISKPYALRSRSEIWASNVFAM